MNFRISERRRRPGAVGAALYFALLVSMASDGFAAQQGLAPGESPTPRDMAPMDITGYWVAVITEDWARPYDHAAARRFSRHASQRRGH